MDEGRRRYAVRFPLAHPIQKGIERVPQVALYQGLKHPGEGSKTFPGTRAEAVGRFVAGSAYPRVADAEELHKQALAKYPAPVAHYYESLQLAEEASKELDIPFRPEDRQELGWQHDLETALDEADIAVGDYGHRLRILVDEYIRHKPEAKGLRQWAQQLSAPEYRKQAESEYVKLRKAYTPNWNSYYEQVIKRYEDMIVN